MTVELRWGTATQPGRTRQRNEDSHLAEPPVFAVADGMGGHAAGEVASRLAVEGLARLGGAQAVDVASVVAMVRDANSEILRHSEGSEEFRGMGTTVVGLAVTRGLDGDRMLAFNVGDSRVYRLRDDRLEQMSVDHSEVAELVAAGQITPEEAVQHPRRNIVTRALGVFDEVVVDVWALDPQIGDRFLLCSDGLSGALVEEHVGAALRAEPDPSVAALLLVGEVVEAGGADDATAVVIDVVGVSSSDVEEGPAGDTAPIVAVAGVLGAGLEAPTGERGEGPK